MVVYLLKQGTIETNSDGEVVGVSRAYIHLLGRDITNVVRRAEARGIRRESLQGQFSSNPQPETGLPSMQKAKAGFLRYKDVLRVKQSTSR